MLSKELDDAGVIAEGKGVARDIAPVQVHLIRVNLDSPSLADIFTDAGEKNFSSDNLEHAGLQQAGVGEHGFFFAVMKTREGKTSCG